MKYVITGATGHLGRLIVESLVKLVDPKNVRVSVRDVSKAKSLSDLGVSAEDGTFEDKASMKRVFEGAETVLIVSPPVVGQAGAALTQNAFDAAVEAKVGRILYTSHMGSSAHSHFPPMINHALAEQALAKIETKSLALRNGFYANAAFRYLEEAIKTGELELPEDGPVAWTTHEDLASYAARALINENQTGETAPLTAGAALDFGEIAEIASSLVGKKIKRTVISDKRFIEKLEARKVPPVGVAIAMGLFKASRSGEFQAISGELKEVLREEPISFREALASWLRV